ncbi:MULTISPECIES: hypothetical protein [unclassified Janthinobacterium]|uniref:hypothetical protein n=1 Tax=unclassified Janthinobacterium TaxID=2610881 RepID=UPI001617E118|nr:MULTISPECIES: hypothetical protein [unclassified Janthinobacterium]MBB5608409.1 hypothetical protein [Janthinobacterium sp. S3T4]
MPFCPFCGQAVAGVAAPKAPPAPVKTEPKTETKVAPVAVSRLPPKLETKIEARLEPKLAPAAKPLAPPPERLPAKQWPRWLAGLIVAGLAIVYINDKFSNKQDTLCNDAIDSGLALVSKGSFDGARVKLSEAQNVCTGKSGAKVDDLQAAISKAVAGSGGCQRSVRAIERDLNARRLQSVVKALAALDTDCAGASTVDQLRKQLARQQAAAASIQVGVRQALDSKDGAAARSGIVKLEALDREYPELAQLKADLQALTAAAAPAPEPVPAPARVIETAPARPIQSEPAPPSVVERVSPAPVDNGAAMRKEMALSFLRDAERSMNDGKFDAAKTYLDSARRVDPDNARIDNLSRRIRERERQVLQTETTIK